MPLRTLEGSRRWAQDGTAVLLDAVSNLSSAEYAAATSLPGWTRRHLVAHVAANADALVNLVHWAATGERTPMYATPAGREAGIQRGTRLSLERLQEWLRSSADRLRTGTDLLTAEQWTSEVVTAQGRTVPAAEIPWLRAREVWVHAVDLNAGVAFADLPEDFLVALEADVLARRGDVPRAEGPLPERVAWLTGRPHQLADAPDLGPWL